MENKHKIFFVGVGGISMSGLALYLKKNGYDVSGSDVHNSSQISKLEDEGIKVFLGHKKSNVKDAELLVCSSAIAEDNPEIVEAKQKGIKIITRSELLRLVSKDFNHVIAISGTHGKTSTTSMVGEIFYMAGLNPTVHIGGVSKNLNTNFLLGDNAFFITEACEYKDNFLSLNPELSLVTNVEEDHMDYFKTKQNLRNSFIKFVDKSGFSVVSENFYELYKSKPENVAGLGKNNKYCWAENIECDGKGKFSFDAYFCGELVGKITLSVYFYHNVMNALGAIAVAKYYKIKNEIIIRSLNSFNGVKRRFEERGEINGSKVVVDYAHHPTEILSTINGAKNVCKKLIVVFQPHTYSRTKKLLKEFEHCFDEADELFIFKTYPAREPYDKLGSAKTLQNLIKKHKKCTYFANFSPISRKIQKIIAPGDMILIMGAGDIDEFADHVFNKLSQN